MATEKKPSEKKLSPKQQREQEKLKQRRKNQKVVVIIGSAITFASIAVFIIGLLYAYVPSMVAKTGSTISLLRILFFASTCGLMGGLIITAFSANGIKLIGRLTLAFGFIAFVFSLGFWLISLFFYAILPDFASFQ